MGEIGPVVTEVYPFFIFEVFFNWRSSYLKCFYSLLWSHKFKSKIEEYWTSGSRMGYTIGIVWCYYTKAWYSIGIVEFLKMSYTLYWNYTKYLDCVKLKYMGSIDFMWSQSGYRVNNFLKRIHIVWINLIELSIKHKTSFYSSIIQFE